MPHSRHGRGRRSGTFGRTSARTGSIEFFTRSGSSLLVQVLGFIIRLRAELTVVVVVVVVDLTLGVYLGRDLAAFIVIGVTVVVFAVPASRRYLTRRIWCVITRHRMRACFAQTRTMTHHGRMPYLLWCRPTPVGERARVWLPAGLAATGLEQVTAELATACWAREARIQPCRCQAALVVVDIIRRDPLSTSRPLTPSVMDNLDVDDGDQDAATVVALPDRADLPDPVLAERAGTSPVTGSTRKNPSTSTAGPSGPSGVNGSDSSVTGFDGVDVSDYV